MLDKIFASTDCLARDAPMISPFPELDVLGALAVDIQSARLARNVKYHTLEGKGIACRRCLR